MPTHTNCPHCGVTWEGDEIPIGLLATGLYDNEKVNEVAKVYGWTPENHRKFSVNVLGIEMEGHDGVTHWE